MSEKITICEYIDSYIEVFKQMLNECFNQDYKIPLTEQQLEGLTREIVQSVSNRITFLDLLLLDGEAKGFVSYQVDMPESDWCEKKTWGCIRELYISADVRGKGYGKTLAAYAESKLWKLSVPNIYLTTDDTAIFWVKAGYHDTGEICSKNNGSILTKQAEPNPTPKRR